MFFFQFLEIGAEKQDDPRPSPVIIIPPPPPIEEDLSEDLDVSVRRRSGLAGHAARADKKNLDKIEVKKIVKDTK